MRGGRCLWCRIGCLAVAYINFSFGFALILLAVQLVAYVVAKLIRLIVYPGGKANVHLIIVTLSEGRMAGSVLFA